jgi:NAD-dependent deacetylase
LAWLPTECFAAAGTVRLVNPDLDAALTALDGRHRILVFTGAGVSTDSGIPDFRGPDGLWTKLDPDDYTYDRYVGDASFRQETWERRFESPFLGAQPNPTHHAVARLHHAGLTVGIVTQNVDGLHLKAGLPAPSVVEIHGNAGQVHCLGCGAEPALAHVRRRWEAGDPDPACEACFGILKTKMVFFGEDMPEKEMIRAWAMVGEADAVLVIGSTLSVYPAAYVPLEIVGRGEPMVIVNRGDTDHDRLASVKLDGGAGEIVPPLVDALIASQRTARR